jgi:hypothetical protein
MFTKLPAESKVVLDQFIPELWEGSFSPLLGRIGSFRYRLGHTVTSFGSMRTISAAEPAIKEKISYEALVETKFRTLNASLVINKPGALAQVVTPALASRLPIQPNGIDKSIPFFRIMELVKPPLLVQTRMFPASQDSKDMFGQLTFRIATLQSPVRPEDKSLIPPTLPFEQRKTWLPATTGIFGKFYLYDPETMHASWGNDASRFSFLPLYRPKRGTFGSTGVVIGESGSDVVVENHVVIERLITDSKSIWRIIHF